jgi:3-methyladenine DNA glycosylase AlkD
MKPVPVRAVLRMLEEKSTAHDLANLERFGISATNALGVSMANIQAVAKQLGRSHELAAELWQTGCYEARMLCSFVEEPSLVTPEQMDAWCRGFDNWGICDTVCFKLFDQTPHAWKKVWEWSERRAEFEKRAAFALLASLAGHDRDATDEQFLASLALIERGATDERNFVKKGVSWALRRIGLRNSRLRAASAELARKLADSPEPAARWVGKDALREFERNPSSKAPRGAKGGDS